mmetsp:Transcript_21871/g.50289  ORF Transcript_21871/g.50289 Transcript_21871/m.50289 type:complete len:251 (+) Transcript_21871:477-1229(+)
MTTRAPPLWTMFTIASSERNGSWFFRGALSLRKRANSALFKAAPPVSATAARALRACEIFRLSNNAFCSFEAASTASRARRHAAWTVRRAFGLSESSPSSTLTSQPCRKRKPPLSASRAWSHGEKSANASLIARLTAASGANSPLLHLGVAVKGDTFLPPMIIDSSTPTDHASISMSARRFVSSSAPTNVSGAWYATAVDIWNALLPGAAWRRTAAPSPSNTALVPPSADDRTKKTSAPRSRCALPRQWR